ncbi:CLUMA_CG001562, isoform A [Clunio marinus]|uniref:CLUMA_CG001562, isoform A n=1 Tax=Clunio marinus TaxID=568069 RepID=A0A1J1HNI8_9DIPT|nr:CLUMA_CG001562, isoform A [Clunio marinus]
MKQLLLREEKVFLHRKGKKFF